MDIRLGLEDKLKEWGTTFAGFSDVRDKVSPQLGKYPNAITIGVRLSDAILDEITDKPTFTYFHHYRTVNTLIDQITLRAMLYLQDQGARAYAVPASQTVNDAGEVHSGMFPHKTAAVLAGLGWIGKSGLFVSRGYGPRVRLGTVLTDLPLPRAGKKQEQACGGCSLCVESCPAMALTGSCWEEGCGREHVVDVKACSDYMTTRFKHIGRGAVCGICMRVCPYGIK